uniref:Fibrinogen C-terminal domain-containing protein n=1 Tax=Macrostomum lignano TaxID=282301 RepID=A0A1I8GCR5_9PLAT
RLPGGGPDTGYALQYGSLLLSSSNVSVDSLSAHRGMKFQTTDANCNGYCCAKVRSGTGWWFNYCETCNPNGIYYSGGERNGTDYVHWDAVGFEMSLKEIRLMVELNSTAGDQACYNGYEGEAAEPEDRLQAYQADEPDSAEQRQQPQQFDQTRHIAGSYQALLKRPKQRLQRNYLSINREAARLGYASLRQASDFRALRGGASGPSCPPSANGDSNLSADDELQAPAASRQQQMTRQLPVPMTYGVRTQSGDPLHELLSNRYFTEWQQSRFDRHSVKSATEAVRPDFTQPTMTRAAMLRQRLLPVDASYPSALQTQQQQLPWRLARFERSARPQLDTFRSERARQAAVAAWRAEQSHRQGPTGLSKTAGILQGDRSKNRRLKIISAKQKFALGRQRSMLGLRLNKRDPSQNMLGRYSFDFEDSDEGTFASVSRKPPASSYGAPSLPPPPPPPPPPLQSVGGGGVPPTGSLLMPAAHQQQQLHQNHQVHRSSNHYHRYQPRAGATASAAAAATKRVTATYHRLVLTPFALKFLHRSPPVKSLWLIAFVVCTAVSGFHLWRLAALFNSGYTVLAQGRETPFVFPDVTVCPPSPFYRRDVGKPDNLNGSNRSLGVDIALTTARAFWSYVLYNNLSYQHLPQAQREYTSKLALPSVFRYYLNSSAVLTPLDLVAYCRYQGQLCSMSNFSIFFHPSYGSCLTYHPPRRTVYSSYLDHDTPGLVLQLYTLTPRDWLLTADPQTSMTHRHSFTATLHPPMTWPTFNQVAHVASGRVTSMRIRMRRVWRASLEDDASVQLSLNRMLTSVEYCFGGQRRWCRSFASQLSDRMLAQRQADLMAECDCVSDVLPLTVAEGANAAPACIGIRDPALLLFDPDRVHYMGRYLYISDSDQRSRWIEDTYNYAGFKRSVDCFLKRFPKLISAQETKAGSVQPDPVSTRYSAQVDSGPWFRSTDTMQAAYIAQNVRQFEREVLEPEARRRNASLHVQAYLRRLKDTEFTIYAYQVLQESTGMLEIRPSALTERQLMEVWLYPLSAFLADCGGALGLLLGASLVTLLETLDALLLFLADSRARRRCLNTVLAAAAASSPTSSSLSPTTCCGVSGGAGSSGVAVDAAPAAAATTAAVAAAAAAANQSATSVESRRRLQPQRGTCRHTACRHCDAREKLELGRAALLQEVWLPEATATETKRRYGWEDWKRGLDGILRQIRSRDEIEARSSCLSTLVAGRGAAEQTKNQKATVSHDSLEPEKSCQDAQKS